MQQGQYGDACDLMTPQAQAHAGGGNASGCSARVGLGVALLGHQRLQDALARADSIPITVTENRATVPSVTGTGGTTQMAYSRDHWLIGLSSG
jgi:hypothetical protein